MSISKVSLLTLIFASQVSLAIASETCTQIRNSEGRSLRYFSCLQEDLADAQIKAKIKEAQDQSSNNSEAAGFSVPSFTNPVDIPHNDTSAAILNVPTDSSSQTEFESELPQYIAYSASKTSKEAVVAYGNSEVRVNKGSVLSGGWTVVNFNEHSMTVSKKSHQKSIPLTIVRGGNALW